jgi:hypothetical protein
MTVKVVTELTSSEVEVPSVEEFKALQDQLNSVETTPGPKGGDGKSAYDIWLDAGNTGTEADFLASLKGDPGNSVREHPWEIVVSGGYNDAAIQAAMSQITSGKLGNALQKVIVLPPGEFHLNNPLLTQAIDNKTQVDGLSIRGQGKRLTKIIIDKNPAASTNNWDNNFITAHGLRFFTLKDFTVVSANENNNFAYLWSLASGPYNQEWNVESVEFQGPWNRVFGIDGDSTANLNSEFVIRRTSTATNSRFKDAFFRSGISGPYNQQNQFLNYWVTDSQFALTSGTLFRLDRGGSLRVARGSWSAVNGTDGPITFFYMPSGNYNNRSATQLSVSDVRFEPKAANHKIIDCAWGSGSVTFDNCSDLGSAQKEAAYEWNLHRYVGQSPWGFGAGPVVRYNSHQGVGYHQYDGPTQQRGNIVYNGCYFYRGQSGNKTTVDSVLRWSNGSPKYRFVDCDNIDNISNSAL